MWPGARRGFEFNWPRQMTTRPGSTPQRDCAWVESGDESVTPHLHRQCRTTPVAVLRPATVAIPDGLRAPSRVESLSGDEELVAC
jgi:hypothetical protein